MLPYHLRKGPCPSTGAVATLEQRCPRGGTPAAKSMARSEVHFGDVGLRLSWVGWVGLGESRYLSSHKSLRLGWFNSMRHNESWIENGTEKLVHASHDGSMKDFKFHWSSVILKDQWLPKPVMWALLLHFSGVSHDVCVSTWAHDSLTLGPK